jgi:hypothetical protein
MQYWRNWDILVIQKKYRIHRESKKGPFFLLIEKERRVKPKEHNAPKDETERFP